MTPRTVYVVMRGKRILYFSPTESVTLTQYAREEMQDDRVWCPRFKKAILEHIATNRGVAFSARLGHFKLLNPDSKT